MLQSLLLADSHIKSYSGYCLLFTSLLMVELLTNFSFVADKIKSSMENVCLNNTTRSKTSRLDYTKCTSPRRRRSIKPRASESVQRARATSVTRGKTGESSLSRACLLSRVRLTRVLAERLLRTLWMWHDSFAVIPWQVQAIREGLMSVIPKSVLSLLTWSNLERGVCGDREISLQQLKTACKWLHVLYIVSSL